MRPRTLAIVTGLWLCGIAGGVGAYRTFASTPGRAAPVPARWPTASRLASSPGMPTVLLFAHPDCPCTRASLAELRVALEGARPVRATVVFASESPELRVAVSRLPGVQVYVDDGTEAARFGARTSGFTVGYDAAGSLGYAGGITGSRGHTGANVGRRALHDLVVGTAPTVTDQPTFGCGLETP